MWPRWARRAAGMALLTLLAAGCAPLLVDEREREAEHEAFLAERSGIESWLVHGRAGIRAEGEAVSLSLRWRQEPDRYDLHLSGPFGAGAVRVAGDADGVTLWHGDGRTLTAATPEDLLASQTGHRLPVTALRDWILGRPAEGKAVEARELDRQGRPARLVQAGWEIDYRGWTEVNGLALPARMDLSSGDKHVRVALASWEVGGDG